MRKLALLVTGLCTWLTGFTQGDFYDTDSLREIRIYFSEPNWDYILDSLYVEGLENRLTGTIVIDGTQLDSVGIRYKGYSSVSTTRLKNPFNIDIDYVYDQDYQGYDKIKLSNVIQDPSFLREVLTYEIARKYMPASKANFANVYINDTLWGLYTNVEAVNKGFLSGHYGSRGNTFVKGNPESLDLNGENSNLGDSHGTDSTDYYPYYEMKSDYGWGDLYNFIDTLNNYTSNIENVLNVDRALWMHAVNYSVINFDSYVGYAQNYYLYEDDNGRFNPILWDLNMSFASYRLTDDSDYWSGFSIAQASLIDPLSHYNSFSVHPRPLMRNLFNEERYRKMYMAHIRTIMEENIVSADYYMRAMELQALIDTSVVNDTNKFYSYSDFLDNVTNTVSDLIDYPGLTELMDARATYLSTLPGYQGAPTIDTITPTDPHVIGGTMNITVKASDADSVFLNYRFGSREVFQTLTMFDDGLHNDGAAGDSIYAAEIPNIGNSIQYYFYAENDSAGKFSPVRAAYEYYTLETQIAPQDIVINEFMTSNTSVVTDQNGEYEDWIELYNTSANTLSTGGLYLTDDLSDYTMWPMPDVLINPGEYLIIWADKDSDQDGHHANFKLSVGGEAVGLAYGDGTVIDSVTYGSQYVDGTWGRYPNGTGPFDHLYPTFAASNSYAGIEEPTLLDFAVYPNPAQNGATVQLTQPGSDTFLQLMALDGREIMNEPVEPYNAQFDLDLSDLPNGMYFIKVTSDNKTNTKRLIVTK